jgi:predicted protein tyrosine phosphatase
MVKDAGPADSPAPEPPLTDAQADWAVRQVTRWFKLRSQAGHGPPTGEDVSHSALLPRLFRGLPPLAEPPPVGWDNRPVYPKNEPLRLRRVIVRGRNNIDAVAPGMPHVVLSIRDQGAQEHALRHTDTFLNALLLEFRDFDPVSRADQTESARHNGLPMQDLWMRKRHARQIWDFLNSYPEAEGLVVHCNAGESRSPAVAMAVCDVLGLNRTGAIDWVTGKGERPPVDHVVNNKHVYRMMVQAADDLGYPAAKLCYIESMVGYCALEKARRIYDLVGGLSKEHGAVVGLETGVFGGRSLVPAAMALRDLRAAGFILGVDPYSVASAAEGFEGESEARGKTTAAQFEHAYRVATRSIDDLGLGPWCGVLRAESAAVAPVVPPQIHYLHIDGNHSEKVATRDVALYLPRVCPGGVVILDDTNLPGVQEARRVVSACCRLEHADARYEIYVRNKP